MKIEFTTDQLALLDKAIQQLPYYMAAPLIEHINEQIGSKQNTIGPQITKLDC